MRVRPRPSGRGPCWRCPVLLVQYGRSSGLRNPVDVVLQSRPSEYGPGRGHPNAASGHGGI